MVLLFPTQVQPRMRPVCSCPVSLLFFNLKQLVPQPSVSFMTLTFWQNTGPLFCRTSYPSVWACQVVSSRSDPGLAIWQAFPAAPPSPRRSTSGGVWRPMAPTDLLVKLESARFLPSKSMLSTAGINKESGGWCFGTVYTSRCTHPTHPQHTFPFDDFYLNQFSLLGSWVIF